MWMNTGWEWRGRFSDSKIAVIFMHIGPYIFQINKLPIEIIIIFIFMAWGLGWLHVIVIKTTHLITQLPYTIHSHMKGSWRSFIPPPVKFPSQWKQALGECQPMMSNITKRTWLPPCKNNWTKTTLVKNSFSKVFCSPTCQPQIPTPDLPVTDSNTRPANPRSWEPTRQPQISPISQPQILTPD